MASVLNGIAASPGVAVGKVFVLNGEAAGERQTGIQEDQNEAFQQALAASKEELAALRRQVSSKSGEETAAVFDAHLMMLEDVSLIEPILQAISQGKTAVEAVRETTETLAALFAGLEDEYMRERAADVTDIGRRLIRHLTGGVDIDWNAVTEPIIVVARDLTPSDTAQLDPRTVIGFATESGGKTSHSAILARTFGIPAIVGVKGLLEQVNGDSRIVIDGDEGKVFVDPDGPTLMLFGEKAEKSRQLRDDLMLLKEKPAVTLDGHRVELAANVAGPRDVAAALANGAESIGLYRTEFLFMGRETAPDEDEQYEAYKAVLEGMQGRTVVIRTLDVGGDKQIAYLNMPQEDNPFLGWRALRMCLDRPDFFKIQLRALWRAGCCGDLKIMFPMVSHLDEVKRAKQLLSEAREELLAEGKQVAESLPVGVMIEIPAAALIADQLAREVDFFSIGSNDLIQYTIGVDRMNETIAHLYQPLHPGVLRLIAMVIDAAHRHGRWVGMCGEMAGDISCIPVLLGLGLDEFSMSAGSIPVVKKRIQSVSAEACRSCANQCLTAGNAAEVKRIVENAIQ